MRGNEERDGPAHRAMHGLTVSAAESSSKHSAPSATRWIAVLGVVYGDIGTSPLYALKSSLQVFEGVPIADVEVMGILSLFFWSLVLIVTVKYVMLVMRADNHGEGGILALMALAQRVAVNTSMRNALAMVGIVGACLFFGDGIITPAISVLSAVEGLEVAAPTLGEYVLPISVAVIILLFAMQYRGTHVVGRVFGPIMALWFVVLAVLGIGGSRIVRMCCSRYRHGTRSNFA
jgi:KUP system potassium uptake protein